MKLHDLVPNPGTKKIENELDVVFLLAKVKPLVVVPKVKVLVLVRAAKPIVKAATCLSIVVCPLCVDRVLLRETRLILMKLIWIN